MTGATAAEWAAVTTLALYFLLSVLGHIPGAVRKTVRSYDLFEWLPYWNFFAPRPGTSDCHLLYRDQLPDGSLTSWREIPLTTMRRWWHGLWNPQRRLKKALFDAASGIRMYNEQGAKDVRFSVPYLDLLTYISGLPRLYPATATQFLVMFSSPADMGREPQEAVRSALHSL